MNEPLPKHQVVEKDGYVLTFHPGFLRRGRVQVDGTTDVLYSQGRSHDAREQPDEPLTRFELRLRGGPNDRDFTLHVDDPQRAIAEIVVRLYPRSHEAGAGDDPDPDEEFRAENGAILCPPIC